MTRSSPPLVVPPVVFLAAGALMLLLDRLIPTPRLVSHGLAWLAAIPVAIALLLAGWAIVCFVRAGTSPKPWETPSALVTSGPYRWSRNPMYLAMLFLLCGWWVSLGSAAALIGLPLYVIAIEVLFIRKEERVLGAHFGEAFHRYRARVRRWL